MDKLSYSLGLSIGHNFRSEGIKITNTEDFLRGMTAALEEHDPEITFDDAKQVITEYFTRLQQERVELNRAAGAEFQMINGKKAGVTTLPSGVQYEILEIGEGDKPQPTDQVKVHYHGTLINGTVFDSSIQRGEPATFPVNAVIQGWQEILPMMPVGSKWRVTIPYQHAYGERGAGSMIEPYSTLIFDIELLGIE